jgi:hypothetical protein
MEEHIKHKLYSKLKAELSKRMRRGQNPILVTKKEHDLLDWFYNYNGKKHCYCGIDIEIKQMKPKAPKKDKPQPKAKTGKVKEESVKRKRRLITYTDFTTGQTWCEYIWWEERN